jgi:uncharacterized protein
VPGRAVVSHIVTFGRVLREAGLEVGPGRVADALKGLDAVGLSRQDDVYWTLRQTLVSRREDIEPFDRAFRAWFLRTAVEPAAAATTPPPSQGERRKGAPPGPGPEVDGGEALLGAWSEDELLRTKDFASMTPEELARAKRLIHEIAVARPQRRTRRLRPDSKGLALDVRALVRASLSTGGDPVERAFRSRTAAPRKLVLILDVSGSMEAYARALLLYLHAARGSGRGVETFAFGTRLTRLTPELGARNPETAFEAAAARVQDWSGGTRIASSLHTFNKLWARRVLTQGAIVLLITDGLERDPDDRLAFEIDRLHRSCRRLIWLNPLLRFSGFEAKAKGIRTMVPHVDELRPIHNLDSMKQLVQALSATGGRAGDPKAWLDKVA